MDRETPPRAAPDAAEVGRVPHPPLLYLSSLVIGFLIQRVFPVAIAPPAVGRIVGPLLVAAGVLLGVSALALFRRAGTNPNPTRPTTALVFSGPYRFTRNPMYLGFNALCLGAAVWTNSLWPVLLLVVAVIVMDRAVIPREEAYLERKFGEAYAGYRRRVRRWV